MTRLGVHLVKIYAITATVAVVAVALVSSVIR